MEGSFSTSGCGVHPAIRLRVKNPRPLGLNDGGAVCRYSLGGVVVETRVDLVSPQCLRWHVSVFCVFFFFDLLCKRFCSSPYIDSVVRFLFIKWDENLFWERLDGLVFQEPPCVCLLSFLFFHFVPSPTYTWFLFDVFLFMEASESKRPDWPGHGRDVLCPGYVRWIDRSKWITYSTSLPLWIDWSSTGCSPST
jgi:hypothetical protein